MHKYKNNKNKRSWIGGVGEELEWGEGTVEICKQGVIMDVVLKNKIYLAN